MFRRKFGDGAYENVIAPLFGGIYASDPVEMPVEHSLSGLMRLEQKVGSLLKPAVRRIRSEESAPAVAFAGGNQRLPEALAEAHSDEIHLETAVDSISDTGDAFEIETEHGETTRVDEVVITVPAPVAADILAELSSETERFRELTYNPMAMVYLEADHDRAGLGYQVRHDEPLHTLGVSWVGPAFDRDGVHTGFLGGMRDPDVLENSDRDLGGIAREEFEQVMDVPAEVIDVAHPSGFPACDHTWDVIDTIDIPNGVHFATNYTARMGVPSRVRQAKALAEQLAGDR
jgi:oxygen-dependent protoporphyrinogen oxidase